MSVYKIPPYGVPTCASCSACSITSDIRTEFVDCTEATQQEILALLVVSVTHHSRARCDFIITAGERLAMATLVSSVCTVTNGKRQSS